MEIGSKGLSEVNLVIPQSTSLTFDIKHVDEEGNAVDHTQSTCKMAFQSKDKSIKVDLSQYCECTDNGVTVSIPPSVSEELPVGKMVWDMIATTTHGDSFRLAYGTVTIVDTYAADGA